MESDIAGITLGRTDTALKVSLSGEIDTALSQGSWFIRIRNVHHFLSQKRIPGKNNLDGGKICFVSPFQRLQSVGTWLHRF